MNRILFGQVNGTRIGSWCVGFSRFLAHEGRLKARHQPVAARTLVKFLPFLIFLGMSCPLVPLAWGQDDSLRTYSDLRSGRFDAKTDPDIPVAALRTDVGRRLAGQLHNLRESESKMGTNHPGRAAVLAEINEVKRQLATFAPKSPATADSSPNPFYADERPMTEDELRKMVREMSNKIEQLERRIFVLERRLGTIEQ